MSRSTLAGASAELAPSVLAALPQPLALRIFAALPPDARARCACVCRAWRTLVADESLWLRLDLKPARPRAPQSRVTDAVLRGAAARAGGRLCALDVLDCVEITHNTLLAVVAANSGSLRELRCTSPRRYPIGLSCARLEALLRAAPALRVMQARVECQNVAEARRALQLGLPAGPLRDSSFWVNCRNADEAALEALAADLSQQVALKYLRLTDADLGEMPAALDAISDALLATSTLRTLHFIRCRMLPAAVAALARLLARRSGALNELQIVNEGAQLLDGPAARLLAAALRDNMQLHKLVLHDVDLWREPEAALEVLDALTGHPSMRELRLDANRCRVGALAGCAAALARLVAANSATLHVLNVSDCRLRDAGLRPLLEALPGNTHLLELLCPGNGMSTAFARDMLLPAVRANTSLRSLEANDDGNTEALPYQESAKALVAQRAAGSPSPAEEEDDSW